MNDLSSFGKWGKTTGRPTTRTDDKTAVIYTRVSSKEGIWFYWFA